MVVLEGSWAMKRASIWMAGLGKKVVQRVLPSQFRPSAEMRGGWLRNEGRRRKRKAREGGARCMSLSE